MAFTSLLGGGMCGRGLLSSAEEGLVRCQEQGWIPPNFKLQLWRVALSEGTQIVGKSTWVPDGFSVI